MCHRQFIDRLVQLVLLTMAGVAAVAGAAPATAGGDAGVYFVGVDALPAGDEGRRLAALFAANPGDRWALTDVVKRIARDLGDEAVGLDAPIGHWDPANDPYNFGVVVVRRASHTTVTWPGIASRTDVELDLGWLQIGHDPRTRMSTDELPELRFAVSIHQVVPRYSDDPLTSEGIADLYREAFTDAARDLLKEVRTRYRRDLDRTAADVRYVVVSPAVMQAAAQRQLSGVVDTQRLGEATAAYLEDRLMHIFARDRAFDGVALLPNARAVEYLQAEWSSFARRVAALSTYSAAWQAAGFRAPRLLRAVPLCMPTGEDEVHALEIRSSVMGVTWFAQPRHARVDDTEITVYTAADIKLPLDAARSRAPGAELPPLHRVAQSTQEKPAGVDLKSFIGPFAVQMGVAKATEPLADDLALRLRAVLRDTEPLSHPSYQGSCRDN